MFPAEVFADRGFQVPEIQEDFGQYDCVPEPQEKTESISQNTQEENGTWDWITEPVAQGCKWAEEKISAAWDWTKEKASAFWEGIEKILALLTSVVIVVGHFFKGFGKLFVDTVTGICDMLTNPIENLMGLIHAISHSIETGKAIWQSISESWIRDVVKGDAKSRAEWFGYAAGQIVLAIVGTKGIDKTAKLAKGSKVAQSRRRLTDRLPAPVQKFFSKDGWKNMADYYLRGQKINWKNTLITGATGISLLGMGAFGVPKVVKFIKKIDIDCSFASQQSSDSYLAAMLMPKLDCDFSYDKDGGNIAKSEQILAKVKTYEQARNKALKLVGNLGPNSKPYIGNLKSSIGYRKVVGRQSSDGKVRWRLDYDPKKGPHINVEDFRNGKGAKAKKYAIPFEGDELTFKVYLKQLNR
ncbi:hypothetical protein H2C83_14075 [Thermoactinomyces sp. AMNI-1]|uniref:Uncharacterized protein n=1 Tax=Thermoactinomyces mirandus TaxID=2756294 RepID=A0A7W1XU95_9BACL|nr:hypothetical protein [Thermoactinomyces mirandus]